MRGRRDDATVLLLKEGLMTEGVAGWSSQEEEITCSCALQGIMFDFVLSIPDPIAFHVPLYEPTIESQAPTSLSPMPPCKQTRKCMQSTSPRGLLMYRKSSIKDIEPTKRLQTPEWRRVDEKGGASGMDRSDMPLKRRKGKVLENGDTKRSKGIEWCPKVRMR